MGKRKKVILHPAVKIITDLFGGKQKIAEKFLVQLFRHGWHIAQNGAKKPPRKDAA